MWFARGQKNDTYFRLGHKDFQRLDSLPLKPGAKLYLSAVQFKKKGFGRYAVAAYWKRKYRSSQVDEPWYLLTNLPDLKTALKAYKTRSGIEALFRDCKTGGYNLEGSGTNQTRLTRLVLLIALAYTWASLQGQTFKQKGVQPYTSRLTEEHRSQQRHSNFWVGVYGTAWIHSLQFCSELVASLMELNPHKRLFYLRGLRAVSLIQSTF